MVVMAKRTMNNMDAAAEGQKFHCVFGTRRAWHSDMVAQDGSVLAWD